MKTILNYAIIAFLALAFSLKGDCMSEERPQVVMTTTLGDITIELYNDLAPITAKNFLKYAEEGHYEGTIFHRVIGGFMVQGGGMNKEMQERKTHPPIKNEAKNGLSNKRGTIAMARTNVVDSATSQFFINVVDNAFLDYRGEAPHLYGYCVFGEVVEGMDVVDQIRKVKTGTKAGHQDVPLQAIEITKVSIQ